MSAAANLHVQGGRGDGTWGCLGCDWVQDKPHADHVADMAATEGVAPEDLVPGELYRVEFAECEIAGAFTARFVGLGRQDHGLRWLIFDTARISDHMETTVTRA